MRPTLLLLVAAMLLFMPLATLAQVQCGDVDLDGQLTVADIVFLANYLFDNGPAPESLWTADMDGVAGVTVSDLQRLTYVPIIPQLPPNCTVLEDTFSISPDDTLHFSNTKAPPALGTNLEWSVELWYITDLPGGASANGLTGLSLPFSYACSTSAITLDTIIPLVDFALVRSSIDTVSQTGLFAFSGVPTMDTALGGANQLANLVFRIAQPDQFYPTDILIDTTGFAPSHTTVAVHNYLEPWRPTMRGLIGSGIDPAYCCVGQTGDINLDGSKNLTDLTLLVNHLFVSFEPLVCRAAANMNMDQACTINLTDLNRLVLDLFVCFSCQGYCSLFDNSLCGQ